MKIALASFRSDPGHGGAERYVVDLAAALAQPSSGLSVELLSSRFDAPIPGVLQIPLDVRAPTRSGQYKRFLDSFDAQLDRGGYDVVHAMLPVRRCDVYHPHAGMARANYASKWLNRFNRKRRLHARVEAELLEGSSNKPIVLCLSDYIKCAIVQHYPNLGGRLEKLFNAVDMDRFDPAAGSREKIRRKFGIAGDQVLGLMIAQDFARKGLAWVIRALAQPSCKPITLLVAGREPVDAYQSQARRLGVADRVVFAGATDVPRDFYAAADFFVLPTRHDPCSLVVLEALAMGVPVISTIFNGACEIMTDGVHGRVLARGGDIPALSGAMAEMLDSGKRAAMNKACLALRPQLSFQSHVDRLLAIYARCKRS